jgi:hypothetical protein
MINCTSFLAAKIGKKAFCYDKNPLTALQKPKLQ